MEERLIVLLDWIDEKKRMLKSQEYIDLMNLIAKLNGTPLEMRSDSLDDDEEDLNSYYNEDYIERYI
tara:strand:+ start:2208 stop:2408 length:201 start_codon:yes stop_codon:yes gene_type:complete